MQIAEPKSTGKNRTAFAVTLTEEERKQAEDKAVQELGKSVNIQGFRPGKAPADMVRSKIKPEAILEEVIRATVPSAVKEITDKHTLQPVIPPSVNVETVEPLVLTITFVEKPQVKVKGGRSIAVPKEAIKVDEKDVQRTVDYVLEQHRTTKAVERAAKEGDEVTMDFSGTDEAGVVIPGTESTGYRVRIGSKSLIPGFEEQLVGLETNGEKKFTVTFPDNYHAEHLQGKPATFSVKVTKVEEVVLPELTDEFAKNELRADSAADFRKRVEDSMRQQEERLNRQKQEEKLLQLIIDATEVDLAEELVDREANQIGGELMQQLQDQNMSLDDWLTETSRTRQSLDEELRKEATRRLKLRYGLETVITEREITVTPEEVQQALDELLEDVPENERAEAKAQYAEGTRAYEDLKWRRTVMKFLEEALA